MGPLRAALLANNQVQRRLNMVTQRAVEIWKFRAVIELQLIENTVGNGSKKPSDGKT
jgi:hypothetical protein